MADEWYCQFKGKVRGPFGPSDLKRMAGSGELQSSDLVRKTAAGNWVAAGKVKGLAFKSTAESGPPSSPPAELTCPSCHTVLMPKAVLCVACGFDQRTGTKVSGASLASEEPTTRRGNRRWLVVGIGLVAAVALGLVIYIGSRGGSSSERPRPDTSTGGQAQHSVSQEPSSVKPKARKPESPTPAPVQPVLESGLRVTGSATFKVINRRVNISDVTYQQARLQLQVVNDTEYPIQFGTRMLLIETNADGSAFGGVLVGLRLPPDPEKGELWHARTRRRNFTGPNARA